MSSVHNTARILSEHQRLIDDRGSCLCGSWPTEGHVEPWTLHVAKALHDEPEHVARQAHEATMIGRR